MKTCLSAIEFSSYFEKLTRDLKGRKWVFEEIDNWLKQKDQRFFLLTGEPGVGKSTIASNLIQNNKYNIVAHHYCRLEDKDTVRPSRVLRSIAAQLDEAFPCYGDALFNTIKSTLSGEVDINIEKIDDLENGIQSSIKRFKINNVNTSDIANELDILIRAPLAKLPEIYKEHGKDPPQLAIILIDALDVAVTMGEGVQEDEDLATLFARLSEDESLPSWVRFLFITRPDRRVLREFEPLKPYLLQEREENNLLDISNFVERRIAKSPALEQQVAATSVDMQGWVAKLTERSQGNFRFIKSLLDDLEMGRCSLKDLSTIPLEVAKSYDKDFKLRFPKAEWGDRHKLILKTLAEAEQPLTEDELATLTEMRPRRLRQDLWGLRQFLDVGYSCFNKVPIKFWLLLLKMNCLAGILFLDREDQYETFTIFHSSLRQYLSK